MPVAQHNNDGPLTTRDAVVKDVAESWLKRHVDVAVTVPDLAKTLQQLLTEIFRTRAEHRRAALPAHALDVLGAVGLDAAAFAPTRTFSKSADLPTEYAAMLRSAADVLAPLAAAVQLARIPVADAAERVIAARGASQQISRRDLRGFVVGRVRPFAQELHHRVGPGETAHEYLRLILRELGSLALAVADGAEQWRGRPARLSEVGAASLSDCYARHAARLTREAAARYREHSDDIVGAVWLKLAEAYRINPGLDVGYGFVRQTALNAANDYFAKLAARREHEGPWASAEWD